MDLEKQVTSLEMSTKLLAVGLIANPQNAWILNVPPGSKSIQPNKFHDFLPQHYLQYDIYPAYTVAELVQILYSYTKITHVEIVENMPDYLAELVLSAIETGEIDPKQIHI